MSATIGIVRPKAEEEIKNVFERDYPNGDYDVIRAQQFLKPFYFRDLRILFVVVSVSVALVRDQIFR